MIIVSLSISLVMGIISVILFLILRREAPSYLKVNEKQHIIISISDLSFQEIEELMNSEIIQKNHILLNETLENINNLIIFCENSSLELNEINPDISFVFPDFLQNPIKPALKVAKSDIELYQRKYKELINNINNFINITIDSVQNISLPLNNMKNEINKLIIQYEEIIRSLCIPFILEQKRLHIINATNKINEKKEINLRKLSIIDQIEEYKNETENLNILYNEFFQYINKETQIIEDEIKEISILATDFKNKIEDDISKYKETMNKFTDPNDIQKIHENLIDIKSSLISTKDYFNNTKNDLEVKINAFENGYRNRIIDFEEFENENDEIIENLSNSSNIIKNDIIKLNENKTIIEILDLNTSSLIADYIIKSLDRTVQIIKEEKIIEKERIKFVISIINVVEKTS